MKPPVDVSDLPIQLPARPADGHKGTFGRVLIIAGSRGMSGAACLSGVSALRGGAGLVSVAVPQSIQPIVASYEPSYLTLGFPDTATIGPLDERTQQFLLNAIADKDAIAVGPGLSHSEGTQELVRTVLRTANVPVVVDADGLNGLANELRSAAKIDLGPGPRILTPHPGEFARLCGLSIGQIQANRTEVAREFAMRYGVVLLLKGPRTIITDGERIAFNATGNSGMATGGSGDVLTGLIAALLGQGLAPYEAARTGAHLHGLAGDLAAEELSEPGLIASDLPLYLARAWKNALNATAR